VRISARNRLAGTVRRVTEGGAIANVELELASGERLVASITVEAVRELGLREGVEATAVIKASDVLIAVDH
jgi:molybdate transport system regulatory protein